MSARSFASLGTIVLSALALIATAEVGTAQQKKREKQPAPAATPAGDKRDRVVAAPGSPFNGKAYWQATAQCGGLYFKIGALYSDSAIKAKVVKPDPTALAQFTKSADQASRSATAFFEAAERFLIADRKVARDEAVLTYDGLAAAAGDRVTTVEAAVQAARACPDLYQTCRGAFPQVCNDGALAF